MQSNPTTKVCQKSHKKFKLLHFFKITADYSIIKCIFNSYSNISVTGFGSWEVFYGKIIRSYSIIKAISNMEKDIQ